MGLTGWSTSNYLQRTSQVINAYPFYVSFWIYRNIDTSGAFTAVAVDATGDHRRGNSRMSFTGSARWSTEAQSWDGATAGVAESAVPTLPLQTWTHTSCAYVSNSLRESRFSGGSLGTNGTSSNPNASDHFSIGNSISAEPFHNTSGLAEVSVWNITGLTTEANRNSLDVKLAAGESPVAINAEVGQLWTGLLVGYWRLLDTTDINDYSVGGTHDLSVVGTLTNHASHPPVANPPTGILITTPTDSISVGDTRFIPAP